MNAGFSDAAANTTIDRVPDGGAAEPHAATLATSPQISSVDTKLPRVPIRRIGQT
ncbi:hypothetical protein I547_5557 [Mycobacterium kansasii 824]|nr:hypothetical protein I547_5557 [Mycobacterium kansasii 824]